MPTYVYRCPKCGHEFEKFHKITAKTRPKCPRCGQTTERVITGGAGLLFKGSGFYITDYRKGPEGQEGQEGQKGQKGQKSDKPADKPGKPAPKKSGDDH
jgi:putative FmdB family regulatory protein